MSISPRRPAGLPWTSSINQGGQSALESLAAHKLRSALTLLGTVIAVATVLGSMCWAS